MYLPKAGGGIILSNLLVVSGVHVLVYALACRLTVREDMTVVSTESLCQFRTRPLY